MAAVKVRPSTPGDDFELLLAKFNVLAAKFNALLTKLDGDATIAATDWTSSVGASDTITLEY